LTPRRLRRLYRELEHIVDYFEDALLDAKRRLREVKKETEKLGDKALLDAVRDLEEYVDSKVREFNEKYREIVKYVEKSFPEIKVRRGPHWIAITMLPRKLARSIGEEVEEAVRTALEETRRALESATTVISSIRLREEDVSIIDELVEAGVFKSRSEAVAFFTKKGIEASRDWLEKVREHLTKIKELREQVKKELEKGEEKGDGKA